MKGKKIIIFGSVLLLVVNLCGCGNGGYEQQPVGGFSITENSEGNKETLQEDGYTEYIPSNVTNSVWGDDSTSVGDTQKDTDNLQQNNFELTKKTEVDGADVLEENLKLGFLMDGSMGDLGVGTLVYTVPDRDDEDYRLYFFKLDNGEDRYLSFDKRSFNLSEAFFVFPDVREGNVPIGKFKEIYFMDYTDVLKDGSCDVIVIAVYEKDGNEYYDTRVYEEREKGFVVNVALTQELNEKYYNVGDYFIWDIVTAPGE